MNASIKGVLLVKADRIDERIDLCAEKYLNRFGENLNATNFKEFIKSIHIIVDTELTEKGDERKWKNLYQR